jgi:hypothetical protein
MFDDGSTDHFTQVMFGGSFLMQRETNAARVRNGGYVNFFGGNSSIFGTEVGANRSYIRFSGKDITFRGRFGKTNTDSGESALYVDQIGGSGTSATVTYGATMDSIPIPFVDIQPTSGGATGKYHCIGSRANTNFTVVYPSGNCDIFIWAVQKS